MERPRRNRCPAAGSERSRDAGASATPVPRCHRGVPDRPIQAAIEGIVALLEGEDASDLSEIELDLRAVPAFNAAVYRIARTIPPGETLTYGEIAARLNDPGAARAVGQALGANPIPIIVPCHRVLAAGGRAGGFSAPGGVMTKLKLLEIERRRFPFALT